MSTILRDNVKKINLYEGCLPWFLLRSYVIFKIKIFNFIHLLIISILYIDSCSDCALVTDNCDFSILYVDSQTNVILGISILFISACGSTFFSEIMVMFAKRMLFRNSLFFFTPGVPSSSAYLKNS